MGRAMLIIVAGLMVALGYVFMGMSNQKESMTRLSVEAANRATVQNLAHTGVQFAITKFDKNGTWTGKTSKQFDYGLVEYSVQEISDTLRITSTGKIAGAPENHTIITSHLIQDNVGVVPAFESALSLITDNFTVSKMGGSFSISGNASAVSGCPDKPGVEVIRSDQKDQIEDNSGNGGGKGKGKGKGGGNKKGISGSPAIEVDSDLDYADYEETVARLIKRGTKVTDKTDINNSGPANPGVFVIDDQTKLNGNVTGYGILIIRDGGRINGNFDFNGLTIFEDEDVILGNGTADLNGSVLVGTTNSSKNVDLSINGNFGIQYDCRMHQYADLAARNALDKTYKPVSIYH